MDFEEVTFSVENNRHKLVASSCHTHNRATSTEEWFLIPKRSLIGSPGLITGPSQTSYEITQRVNVKQLATKPPQLLCTYQ